MGENPFAYDDFDQAELPVLQSDLEKQKQNNTNSQQTTNYNLNFSSTSSTQNQTQSKPPSAAKLSKLEQLKAREAELLKRQSEIKSQVAEATLQPNWPPQYPIIRYDIANDLTPSARKTVQYSFYGLILVIVGAVLNTLTILSVTGLKDYSKTTAFIFSIIQGFASAYVGINFSYNGIYNAAKRRDISFRWIITQFCFIGWCVYKLIGFPSSGSVGIAVLLDLLANDSSGFSKFMAFINTAVSGASAFCQFKTLVEAQKYQKISGKNDDEDALHPQDQI